MHVDNHTFIFLSALFHVHPNGLVGVIQLVLPMASVLAGHDAFQFFSFCLLCLVSET